MTISLPANQAKAHDQLQSQYLQLATTNAVKGYEFMQVCNQSTTGSISGSTTGSISGRTASDLVEDSGAPAGDNGQWESHVQ